MGPAGFLAGVYVDRLTDTASYGATSTIVAAFECVMS